MDTDLYSKDAWYLLSQLMERYTLTADVRDNIQVIGHGTDRGVELRISTTDYNRADPRFGTKPYVQWMSTGSRNVGTMRELAQALNEACDFVEASNPGWASHE